MVTIRDVALKAGVSHKTVSRVVNGEPNVTAATREIVERTINELNYVPNQGARLMRSSRSGVIGVMSDVVSTSPNSTEILHGIQDFVANTPYSVIIANTGGDPETERKNWRIFRQHRIDGVLYVTMYHRSVRLADDVPDMPMVMANCYDAGSAACPAILPDDYGGGLNAARLAISKGHRRIGFVTLNPAIDAARLRYQAFHDAMHAAGHPIDPELVTSGYDGPVGQERLVAFDRVGKLLSMPESRRPTILLCGNDEIAMQALCAASRLGIQVPQQLAVIGFDDFRLIAANIVPSLTTIRLPYHAIGMRATERLLALIGGKPDIGGTERIECPVIERQSA